MIQKAVVKTVTFHNPENGYSVLRLTDPDSKKIFTAVGRFPKLTPGETLEIEGEWSKHEVFGEQFKASGYRLLPPDSLEAMERFLGGGALKGVGQALAKRLVAKFGLETFDVLDNHPERLSEVPRLMGKSKLALLAGWSANKSMREVLYFLQAYELSANLSERIYKEYGDRSIAVLRANPYRLAHEMWGVGFLKADEVARKLGFAADSYERIEAGVEYALGRSAEEGHVFLRRGELLERAQALLKCPPEKLIFTLDALADSDASRVRHDGEDRFYLPYLFHSERGIARRAAQLSASPAPIPKAIIESAITLAETALAQERPGSGFQYSEQQRAGIRNAVARGIFLLTGGPGTGKTTMVLGILEVFKRAGLKVRLAAPTGRAAKRLNEITGHHASTIHRMLKYDPAVKAFSHDEISPLPTDVLVVDELSMIDTVLMFGLVKAVKPGTRLILIGDPDQLPSVGAGKVLAEFIRSGAVAHLHLDRIFRQAEASMIVANAHRINRGIPPVTSPLPLSGQADGAAEGNFHFVPVGDAADGPAAVADLVADRLPGRFGYDPRLDIQVLTPMNQGPLGTIALNQALQERLNPATPARPTLEFRERRFRVRDKVMQLRNNYDKNVYNGDVGYISAVSKGDKTVTVDFDGTPIAYQGEELGELALAYAVTIHKSQGSEFKAVVMLAARAHWIMLQRNLLYTGITRARERLILVGQPEAIKRAVENNPSVARNTMLAEALREEMEGFAF